MKLKAGNKVRFLKDDGFTYRVYAVYPKGYVSLGLRSYPDTEADYLTDSRDLVKLSKSKKN